MKLIFPSWRYHKELEAKIIHAQEEHDALGSEWKHSPADFDEIKIEASEIGIDQEEKPKKKVTKS